MAGKGAGVCTLEELQGERWVGGHAGVERREGVGGGEKGREKATGFDDWGWVAARGLHQEEGGKAGWGYVPGLQGSQREHLAQT